MRRLLQRIKQRFLRKRKWWIGLALAGAVLVAFSIHSPQRQRITIRYRGTPEVVPQELTIYQTLWATRCVPFVSCSYSLWSGFIKDIDVVERHVPATPEGATFEIDTARVFSLGAYDTRFLTASANPGERERERHMLNLDHLISRYTEKPDGGCFGNYHILDVGTPSFFRVPLPMGECETEVVIDYNPIVYTRFYELPDRGDWLMSGTQCSPTSRLLMSLNVPRVLKYGTTIRPQLRAGQTLPVAKDVADVFMTAHAPINHERPSPEEWRRWQLQAIHLDNVLVKHDTIAKTVTVEVTAPPKQGDSLDYNALIVVVGTPSADGRYFGMDCVRLEVESEGSHNPILYTVFADLPDREYDSGGGNRCHSLSTRVEVTPGVPRTVAYYVKVDPTPKLDERMPIAKRGTEVLLLDGPSAAKLDERYLPEEWENLRRTAIHPKEVQLVHDPKKKTITIKVAGELKGDYALIAGTPSSDGRYFGTDCARLKQVEPKPPAPADATDAEGQP